MKKHCGNCIYLRRKCPVETRQCVQHGFSRWTSRRGGEIMDCPNTKMKIIRWEQCYECGEYMPSNELTLDRETGKYICDVCTYESYMNRRNRRNYDRSEE